MKAKTIKPFKDCIVIYEEDGRWVAHSIETDQIGIDKDLVMAVAALIKTVHNLLDMASIDPTIAYKRKAPQEIIKKIRKATPLPNEVYKLACDMYSGVWPKKDIEVTIIPKSTRKTFSLDTSNMAYC